MFSHSCLEILSWRLHQSCISIPQIPLISCHYHLCWVLCCSVDESRYVGSISGLSPVYKPTCTSIIQWLPWASTCCWFQWSSPQLSMGIQCWCKFTTTPPLDTAWDKWQYTGAPATERVLQDPNLPWVCYDGTINPLGKCQCSGSMSFNLALFITDFKDIWHQCCGDKQHTKCGWTWSDCLHIPAWQDLLSPPAI